MESVLVTGGAGYLGSILVPELLKNYKVTIYDNFMYGTDSLFHFITNPNLKVVYGDVRDTELLKTELKNHDHIVHLAAIVGYPACAKDHTLATSVNFTGTKNIIDCISDNQNFIFASTGSTYGRVQDIATEETEINPVSLYGKTKSEAENYVMNNHSNAISLRYATVYGVSPRMRLDLLINDFIYKAIYEKQIILYEGHFKRTFIHNLDAVRSIIYSISNFNKMKSQIYNVGDNKLNYKKIDIANIIKESTGCFIFEANVGKDLDQRDYEVSYEKINNAGFKCQDSLENTIGGLIKAIKCINITNKYSNV